jgi:hypothetical protein
MSKICTFTDHLLLGFFFLLADISCTGECHYDISICTYNVPLLYFPPPSFSLIPLLRTISKGFIVQFSYMYTKYVDHIHPPSFTGYLY